MTTRMRRALPAGQATPPDALSETCQWSTRSARVAVGERDSVLLQETVLPPDLSLGYHAHPPGIFCLVVAGGFRETCERRDRTVAAAETVYYPPSARHAGRFANGSVLFSIDVPEQLLDAGSLARTITFDKLGPRLTGLTLQLRSELHVLDGGRLLAMESLVAELLADASALSHSPGRRSAWLPSVLEILRERTRQPPSLAELAREVDIHPSHLARAFRQTYRCTVGSYVRYLRVGEAAARLAMTTDSLSDVANDAGFADQSHFGRVFKQVVGVTPGRYRSLLS